MARRTPLHGVHLNAGARMVEFAGWDMPVQYTRLIEEHLAVRKRAGLCDVSHMGEVSVAGRDALSFLQALTCNDVSRLANNRAQYNAVTTPAGTFVDDLLVYRLGDAEFLLVVNASNTAKDVAWLQEHASGRQVDVRDVSAEWAQMSLQGPRAAEILERVSSGSVAELRYYSFVRCEVDGVPSIVSRTGYTGEDGFEIYAPERGAERIWYTLLGEGAPQGLVPTGLGARDTLRLEARMLLYGNDIDDSTTVLEADLGWIVKLDKGEFLGRGPLAAQSETGPTRKLVGFEMVGRVIARHGHEALQAGRPVGRVTSGSFAPFLDKSIGLAYLPRGMWEPGTRFHVDVRGRQQEAIVVQTPFYKRAR